MRALTARVQRQITDAAVGSLFAGAKSLGVMSPGSEHERFGISTIRDVAYDETIDQRRLDVIVPRGGDALRPVVVHVHGGAFTMLSKESHHPIAEAFARRGYVVFNVGYRLAPEHPFPAAPSDVAAAYVWIVNNAHRFGGDVDNLVLAGESAGANLILGLALSATTRRTELFARRVFESGVVPRAIVSFSGLLQLSSPDRFGGIPGLVAARELRRIRKAYVGRRRMPELADPLLVLERGPTERAFPALIAPNGSADPLHSDSLRLARTLSARGVTATAPTYVGEPHSFHAFMWRDEARRAWRDTFDFLDDVLQRREREAA